MLDFESLLKPNGPLIPATFFKSGVMDAFLSLHVDQFLSLLRNEDEQKRWVSCEQHWQKFYRALLRVKAEYALDFLKLSLHPVVPQVNFQKLLLEHLLCLRDTPEEALKVVRWLIHHIQKIDQLGLQNELISLMHVHFFSLNWEEIELIFSNTNVEDFKNWQDLHAEYQNRNKAKLQIDDFFWSLPTAILNNHQTHQIELMIHFLVNYHHFPTGWSRSYGTWKKSYPELIRLWENRIHQFRDNLPWHLIGEKKDIHDEATAYLSKLVCIARGKFLNELLIALLITVILTMIFDPHNLYLWLIIFGILNFAEWCFATWKPNKLYYWYKFKFRLIKENQNFDTLNSVWILIHRHQLLISPWQNQLLNLIENDPWQFYPPLKSKV